MAQTSMLLQSLQARRPFGTVSTPSVLALARSPFPIIFPYNSICVINAVILVHQLPRGSQKRKRHRADHSVVQPRCCEKRRNRVVSNKEALISLRLIITAMRPQSLAKGCYRRNLYKDGYCPFDSSSALFIQSRTLHDNYGLRSFHNRRTYGIQYEVSAEHCDQQTDDLIVTSSI